MVFILRIVLARQSRKARHAASERRLDSWDRACQIHIRDGKPIILDGKFVFMHLETKFPSHFIRPFS